MALQSMTALASITLQQASASVSFSGIPQNYRDLVLVVNATIPLEGVPRAYINNDTGSNYSYVTMYGSGTSAQSFTSTTDTYVRVGQTGTGFSGNQFMGIVQFMDYSATDKHKTILGRNSDDSLRAIQATVSRWANTAAINQIQVFVSANSFSAGATFNLYGRIA